MKITYGKVGEGVRITKNKMFFQKAGSGAAAQERKVVYAEAGKCTSPLA